MLGVKTNGSLYTWGSNTYGALGQNNLTQYSSPTALSGTWSIEADLNGQCPLSNDTSGCAMKADGTWWVWGMNTYGQLGINKIWAWNQATTPVQIPGSWDIMNMSNGGGQGIKPPA